MLFKSIKMRKSQPQQEFIYFYDSIDARLRAASQRERSHETYVVSVDCRNIALHAHATRNANAKRTVNERFIILVYSHRSMLVCTAQ